MDSTKSSRSAFSIENILEQKSERKTPPKLFIPIETLPQNVKLPQSLVSPSSPCETVTSSTISRTPDIEQYTAFKSLALKNCENSNILPQLRSHLLTHAAATSQPPPPPLPPHTGNLHYDAVYDPAASLFYQQVLNLQKSSALLMPHFQAAAAAAAMANASRGGTTPSVYCDPTYGQYMECEGESWNLQWISDKI